MRKLGSHGCETPERRAATIRQDKAIKNRQLAKKAAIADLALENIALKERLEALEAKAGIKKPKAPKKPAAKKKKPKKKRAAPKRKKKKASDGEK